MYGFCHVELPATDARKASEFYSSLFGWKISKREGMEYYIFSGDEGGVYGGISQVKKILSDSSVCNYVKVADIPAILRKAESLGAKTTRPKTEIAGGFGFFAILQDPQGYYLGIWAKA